MEKWKVMTAAAAVGVAVVGGMAVSTSVVAADRAQVSSSQTAIKSSNMATFCATAVTRGTYNAATAQCAKPY